MNSSVFRTMARMGAGYWLRAGAIAIAGAAVIAIPTRLVPNGLFARMTPTRPLDYLFLAVSSMLLGLTLAARPGGAGAESRTVVGGVGPTWRSVARSATSWRSGSSGRAAP